MRKKSLLSTMVIAGMTLGTAWAVRGQFGHEQGAAWAGALGTLSIVLLARRDDWYQRALQTTLAGALGWGIGGIMSYGLVVGYGRDVEFVNVYYGFSMLFVIGGLYGFLGGGLVGLALSDTAHDQAAVTGLRVSWPQLIVELTVGAILFYFFLIEQFGWLMTPPRSELWAACLGIGAALTWYLVRHRQKSALRVAVFSGLGAGFGFAFGNFLQVLGQVSGLDFNFWNVMEYSLGFFGGAGMAYGTFTSRWNESGVQTGRQSFIFPLLVVAFIIPFVVWDQSFETEDLIKTYNSLGANERIARMVQWIAFLLILGVTGIWVARFYGYHNDESSRISYFDIQVFFLGHFALYIVYSLLITGAFFSTYRVEQYLYLLNYVLIAFFITKVHADFSDRGLSIRQWSLGFITIMILLALLAFIAIHTHDELPHAQKRFNGQQVSQ